MAKNISDEEEKNILQRIEFIENLSYDSKIPDTEWLYEKTEEWGKEKAIYESILDSIDIIENKPKEKNIIPKKIQDALLVEMKSNLDEEYLLDYEQRFETYLKHEDRYPTHLENLNRAIGGGFKRKTLNVFLGQPGSGKSRMMIDLSSSFLKGGFNVLYVTLELSKKEIELRMDANLFKHNINEISGMERGIFIAKAKSLLRKGYGRFFVKEFPTAFANTNHIKNFLEDLKVKKEFTPDIIVVDYMGIMMPVRFVNGMNSFGYYKNIAEELRGLAVETNTILITGAQLNRAGWNVSHVDLSNIAESAGIAHVADLVPAIIVNDQLRKDQWIQVSILKNRLYKLGQDSTFTLGYNDDVMNHFDVQTNDVLSAMDGSVEETPKKKNLTSHFNFN